jgi:hypothetical protein
MKINSLDLILFSLVLLFGMESTQAGNKSVREIGQKISKSNPFRGHHLNQDSESLSPDVLMDDVWIAAKKMWLLKQVDKPILPYDVRKLIAANVQDDSDDFQGRIVCSKKIKPSDDEDNIRKAQYSLQITLPENKGYIKVTDFGNKEDRFVRNIVCEKTNKSLRCKNDDRIGPNLRVDLTISSLTATVSSIKGFDEDTREEMEADMPCKLQSSSSLDSPFNKDSLIIEWD